MPRKEFLISSYTGSGVAWLLNFLIELDVMVYRGPSTGYTWDRIGERYRLREKEDVLKQWCPVLSEKGEFGFRDQIAVCWTHEFPSDENAKQKTVLLVRDGRDTIYSQFKREKLFKDFGDMLETGIEPSGLRPADTWALMNLAWLNAADDKDLLTLRFEDLKADPMPSVRKLIGFLGISRSEEELKRAAASSDFSRAKKAEEGYRKSGGATQFAQVNRKGQPGEWKGVYAPEQLGYFDGLPAATLAHFGYEAPAGSDVSILQPLSDPDRRKDASLSLRNYRFMQKALKLIRRKDGLKIKLEKVIDNRSEMSQCPLCRSNDIVMIGPIRHYQKQFATTDIRLIAQPEYWRCRACRSGFTKNVVPENEAEKLYAENDGSRWSDNGIMATKPKSIIRALRSEIKRGMSVLDVGCSSGELLDFAKSMGAKTYGIEYSEKGRQAAQGKGHVVYASHGDLPVGTEFDLVFAFDVVEHVYDLGSFLTAYRNKLKPPGKLIILTGNPECLSARVSKNNWWYVSYPEHVVFPSKKFFGMQEGMSLERYIPVFNSIKHYRKSWYSWHDLPGKIYATARQLARHAITGQPPIDRDHALIILKKI